MTELRDARLRRALDEAPDAQVQPHARTRAAIRAAAHGAVQPPWRRWWAPARRSGTPWAAALATLALATLVIVMWEGQEVPGTHPEPPVVAQAPVAAPAPAPAPDAAVTPAPSVQPAPQARPAPAKENAVAPAPARAERERRAPAAPAAPTAPEPSPLADAAPRAQDAPLAAPMPAPAAPAPPPPAAAAPAAGALAERPAATMRSARVAALPWTQVRIEAGGQSVAVAREQAGGLPSLIDRMLASGSDAAGSSPPSLRLELAQGNDLVGVLERVGDAWRWTPLRGAQQPRTLRASPELNEALRQEAERLLR